FEGWMPPSDALKNAEGALVQALGLDDSTPEAHLVFAQTRYFQWDFQGAQTNYQRAISLNPGDVAALKFQSQFLKSFGRWDVAIALVADFASSGYDAAMRNFYRAQLEGVTEASKGRYVSPIEFATIYASLGDRDQAFTWLDKAFEEHAPWLGFIKTDPVFQSLRDDPRFPALLRRIGLPI